VLFGRGFIDSEIKSRKLRLHRKQRRNYSTNVMRRIASCDSAIALLLLTGGGDCCARDATATMGSVLLERAREKGECDESARINHRCNTGANGYGVRETGRETRYNPEIIIARSLSNALPVSHK